MRIYIHALFLEEPELTLEELGFNSAFAQHFNTIDNTNLAPCRVSLEQRGLYCVMTELGEMDAVCTGKMLYEAEKPAIGDWVTAQILDEQPPKAIITSILPRKSMFSRKEAGSRMREQPVAANIDTVFVVMGLDHNFRAARIERYLTLAWESGADPVVVLTKCDLCDDIESKINEIMASAPGVPVHAVSVINGVGLECLDEYIFKGRTVALLGSSGVGKSTIVNYLLGNEVMRVQDVRDDDSRGRHTTTHRQLFVLPSGGMVIDTPGMRELQLWDANDGLSEAFSDIESLAEGCRFRDCTHNDEPGCAVRQALKDGSLDARRFENYRKMLGELSYFKRKNDVGAASVEREKWKKIHKLIKKMKR